MRPLSSATHVLNVDANTVSAGNLVNLFRPGNNATQWFKFEAVGDGYVIRNAQNTNVCLTPNGSGTVVTGYTGSSNQIWYLEKACTVTFNANGGSGAPAAMRVREGYAITIPTEQPTRTCHSFKFWVESQSFSPTTLRGGDTFTIYGDVIISAIWGTAHHTYSGCDDTSCNECGDIRSEAGHIYDNSCDSNCNVCGAERAVEHCLLTRDTEITCSYRVIRTSCVFCDFSTEEIVYTNLMPHTYDDKYDADCNECGAVREVPEKPALIYGDATGDGAVNNRDLAMMQQYINGWEVVVDADACDVNVDGAINNRDLALLQQYINGWDVTLG